MVKFSRFLAGFVNTTFKQLLTSGFSVIAIALLSVSLTFSLYSYLPSNNLQVQAQTTPTCPSGYTWSTTLNTCQSNTPTSYTCPSGQVVSGANCVTQSLSCPSGGVVSGGNCVGTTSSPVNVIGNCPSLSRAYGGQCQSNEPFPFGWTGPYFTFSDGTVVIVSGVASFMNNFPLFYEAVGGPGSTYVASTTSTTVGAANPVYSTTSPVTTPLSPTDILSGNVDFTCGTQNFIPLTSTPISGNPSSTIYNTKYNYLSSAVPTTTCTATLPAGVQLDSANALTLKIGNIGTGNLTSANRLESDTCIEIPLVGTTIPTYGISCLNVPVGSLTGSQTILAKLGANNTSGANYGVFLDSLKRTNVYQSETYYDGTVSFLKGKTGTTNAYNNILHKDWRTGVSGNEARIQLSNLKLYRDMFPTIVNTSSQTNDGSLTTRDYICRIGVRPAGSTGAYTGLVYDSNGNGTIETGETNVSLPYIATDIPYNTATNSCSTLFTNAAFTGGQTVISTSNAKTYNWEVNIDVVDANPNPASPTLVANFKTSVGFKFAAIIPGG